jgi:tRNA nucleotidyltransferase (CCA-adding enzyme)
MRKALVHKGKQTTIKPFVRSKKNLRIMPDNTPSAIQGQTMPDFVLSITRRLIQDGHRAYIVGGALRDAWLGSKPKDWDVATDAMPNTIHQLFHDLTRFDLKHGTVTLVHQRRHYEVTTFRGKTDFGLNIEEDLAHRDFTFNAMAYDTTDGKIIDPFDGKGDITGKVVRAVQSPLERFREDPLRMMRAIRFALELGYSIDPKTLGAVRPLAHTIEGVARERIRDELLKMLLARKPSRGFTLMRKTGLLKSILPELLEGYRKRQNDFHRYTIYRHIMETVDSVEPDPVPRLSALFHDIAKPRGRKKTNGQWRFLGHAAASVELTKQIMTRLRFSNDMIARVTNLIGNHMFEYKRELTERALRRFVKRVGSDNIDDLIKLRRADDLAHGWGRGFEADLDAFRARINSLLDQSPPLTVADLAVNGDDVMTLLGIRPGPEVGEILDRLVALVIEKPELNQKDTLLEFLKDMAKRRLHP